MFGYQKEIPIFSFKPGSPDIWPSVSKVTYEVSPMDGDEVWGKGKWCHTIPYIPDDPHSPFHGYWGWISAYIMAENWRPSTAYPVSQVREVIWD